MAFSIGSLRLVGGEVLPQKATLLQTNFAPIIDIHLKFKGMNEKKVIWQGVFTIHTILESFIEVVVASLDY